MLRLLLFNAAFGGIPILAVTATLSAIEVANLWVILCLSVITVLLIIFGDEFEKRFLRSGWPDNQKWTFRIAQAGVSREAVLPVFLILGLWVFDYVQVDTIVYAVRSKADIIFLILAFSLITQGIKHSDYFKYAAYRVLEVCDGSMTRMTLYLFVLSSVLTYVTSNDIVILVMTPIILTLCRQARISNGRLLLLGQFVAANTLSMGLLIGSPTNIIVATEVGMNFFEYLSLMLVPSLMAVAVSFLVLHGINTLTPLKIRQRLDWKYGGSYLMPALKEQPNFTREMRWWVYGFFFLVGGVALVSHFPDWPFFAVTAPAALVALVALYKSDRSSSSGEESPLWIRSLSELPYQIALFAAAFFIIAEQVSELLADQELLGFILEEGLWQQSVTSIGVTGILVNIMNDLPASALIAQLVNSTAGSTDNPVFLQSILVGLNIACYVTPVGALAGIIWFHIMRTGDTGDMVLPTRLGMFMYGLTHFFFTGLLLSILIPFAHLCGNWLASADYAAPSDLPVFLLGFLILAIGLILLISVLRKEKIFLVDVRAFLTAASWINIRFKRTGGALQLAVAIVVVATFAVIIWLAEGGPTERGSVDSVGDFIVWVLVFLGSGFERGWFPENRLAQVFAGMMPIIAIFLIVRMIQVARDQTRLQEGSRRIARGEIFTRRIVILDYHSHMRGFVRHLWQENSQLKIFQTVLYDSHRPPRQWQEDPDFSAIYTYRVPLNNLQDFEIVVDDYRMDRADEIYLLGDAFVGENASTRISSVLRQLYSDLLDDPEDGSQSEDAKLQRRERCEAITCGPQDEDPEGRAGRLPRIFIWDDVKLPSPGTLSSQDSVSTEFKRIDEAMSRLIIRLPHSWRDRAMNEETQNSLSKAMIDAIASNADEKSWKIRRQLIAEKTGLTA